jgi:molybdopterin-guanine dinucleotide biosynthesis protein A
MGRDKGDLIYPHSQISQRARCFDLLKSVCDEVYLSCREEQTRSLEPHLPFVVDSFPGEGPGVGILSADQRFARHSWLVLACDFPYINREDIQHLVNQRSVAHDATCFIHADGTIEPLFTIWEKTSIQLLKENFSKNHFSPRKVLSDLNCKKIQPLREIALRNVNCATQSQ